MCQTVKIFARVALAAGMAAGLVGCNRGADGPQAAAPPANQVTGQIEIHRSFPACLVSVKLHNGTTYHLKDAGFAITGYDDTLSVKDLIAGGDDEAEMSIPLDSDGSCLALAGKIDAHAADNNVGTCAMEGVSEGECQKLFSFHSAIDRRSIQADIDKLKAGNLNIGDTIPLTGNLGRRFDVKIEIGGNTLAICPDNTLPNWTPTVAEVRRDGDGVAHDYRVAGTCAGGETVQGWVAREEFGQ